MVDGVLIRIDSRVRVEVSSLDDSIVHELKEAFEHRNPEFYKLQHIGLPTYKTPRVIKTWKLENTWGKLVLSVPRGGLRRVLDVLDTYGIDRTFEDNRTTGKAGLPQQPEHLLTPFPDQERLLAAAMRLEQCLLKAPTGSGKTCVAFALVSRIDLPTIVVVPNRALFDQWIERAQTELGLRKNQIGQIRGKKRKLMPLTIAMQKTLSQIVDSDPELLEYFGAFIYDEVQLAAARTCIEAIDPFPAKYRLGISADHRRKDQKEFLIYDLFGGVGEEITRSELIKAGRILDTEIRVIPTEFRADWYGLPDDADEGDDQGFSSFDPDEGKTSSLLETDSDDAPESGAHVREIDFDRLLREMSDDADRNALILDWTAKIAAEQPVLVMSHRREHCRLLDMLLARRNVRTGFLIGGDDYRKAFEETKASFIAGKIPVAVGTFQAIGYGIDLPQASIVMATTPIAGNKQFFGQVRGRICRAPKGKRGSWMYYFLDIHTSYGQKHLKNLTKWNSKVVVWDSGHWVDGKTYLRAFRMAV